MNPEFEALKGGVWDGKVKAKLDQLEKNTGSNNFLSGSNL